MSGSLNKKDTIRDALTLARHSTQISAEKATAMLYALADKFLNDADLEEIREVIKMTKLGQMLLEEGIEKGIKKGIAQGESLGIELSKRLLADNRINDLRRAVEDKAYWDELIKEYGIK